MRAKHLLLPLLIATLLAGTVWVAFQSWTANHFGYALPFADGLPCRLHYRGRDYENDSQCGGMNRSAWNVWYATRHHVSPGGPCERVTDLRRTGAWPLHDVAGISTLLGSSHSVLVSGKHAADGNFTTTVLYVSDVECYRPYSLLGGP